VRPFRVVDLIGKNRDQDQRRCPFELREFKSLNVRKEVRGEGPI
jgi:hypothetical protein